MAGNAKRLEPPHSVQMVYADGQANGSAFTRKHPGRALGHGGPAHNMVLHSKKNYRPKS
jgi:hypothetical protein